MTADGEVDWPAVEKHMDDVITAGAHGCLAESSTPVQIGAALRAAARGDVAELDQPTTGPLVQRVRREAPPLTEREIEVLRTWLMVDTKPATAAALYISLGTVNTHLTRIRAKYAEIGRPAPTKAGLVARAVQDGIVELDEL